MSNLIIRGTRIKEVTTYCSQSGQLTHDIVCRASWSDTVCKEMGWQTEPNGFGNGSLEGKLAAVSMSLEPSAKNLKDYRFEITCNSVHGFKHKAKTEDDTVTKRELEFIVTTVAADAATVLAGYIEHCGPAADAGQCKIQYSAEAQMEIGEGEPVPDKPRGRKKAAAE